MQNLNLHAVTPVEATESSTGQLEVIDLTGDTKVHWDKNKPAEVAMARASYDTLIEKGYKAFKLNSDGTQGEQIREFDPNAQRILLAPQFAGG